MIRLKEDRERVSCGDNWDAETVFLYAGDYQLVREIRGLGWLVRVREGYRGIKEITTIIRYENGDKL